MRMDRWKIVPSTSNSCPSDGKLKNKSPVEASKLARGQRVIAGQADWRMGCARGMGYLWPALSWRACEACPRLSRLIHRLKGNGQADRHGVGRANPRND